MKVLGTAIAILALTAAPSIAQEKGVLDPAGYVSGFGGAAWTAGNSTGSVLFEGGVRVAPHVMVFANVGRFADLQADLVPTIDAPQACAIATNLSGVTMLGIDTALSSRSACEVSQFWQ